MQRALEEMSKEEKNEEECKLNQNLVGSSALSKACFDHFDYAMKLRTGEVINFSDAKVLSGDWVWINVKPTDEQPTENRIAYPAERGMDVRLSDIVWVMDAPCGS